MVMTLEQENSARYHDLHNTTIFTHYKKFDWTMKNTSQKNAKYRQNGGFSQFLAIFIVKSKNVIKAKL